MYFIWIQLIATLSTSKTLLLKIVSYHLLLICHIKWRFSGTIFCFRFPSKEAVLSYVVKITKNHLKKQPRTLVVVGAYSIGKECVYLEISKELGVCRNFNLQQTSGLTIFTVHPLFVTKVAISEVYLVVWVLLTILKLLTFFIPFLSFTWVTAVNTGTWN